MSDEREIVEAKPMNIVNVTGDGVGSMDRLIAMAVEGNADIEKLEKLIDLKNREDARMAKAAYDRNFANMQAEFTPVSRGKQGYDYKYAPIEVLQEHYNPFISKYGFSYRWREEALETGKRSVMVVSGHGHSEETFFDVPALMALSR